MEKITTDILLNAYMCGYFPMSESRLSGDIFWVEPKKRGILPLHQFHAPKSLIKRLKQTPFEIRVDSAFNAVMDACSNPRAGHSDTWINPKIKSLYGQLFELGFAHSVECWKKQQLVGGLYGVSIGGAFFGESMFTLETDASKIALCYLVARLKKGGYTLLDTQFLTPHLARFGTLEVTQKKYLEKLEVSLQDEGDFYGLAEGADAPTILQLITQMS